MNDYGKLPLWRKRMYFGEIIKKTREKLGLIQMDLQTPNLSRNLLSGIEHDKTALTPAKAMILYKQFVDYSWIREIEIDIQFDEVLGNNEEYIRLREANDICLSLYQMIKKDKIVQTNLLQVNYDILDDYRNVDLGILGFSIPYFLGQFAEKNEDYKKAQNLYYAALDNLIVTRRVDIIDLFKTCTFKLAVVSRKLNDEVSIIKYYDYIEFLCKTRKEEVTDGLLYNIALYSKISGDYDKADKYLSLYLQRDITPKDYFDAQIIRANIKSQCNDYVESINILSSLIKDKESLRPDDLALCLSNLIDKIIVYDNSEYADSITEYRDLLLDALPKKVTDYYNYKNYSSIARSYAYYDAYIESHEYFILSFKSIENDHDFNKTITVLTEAYPTYKSLNILDDFIDILLTIDYLRITCSSKVKLLLLISIMQSDILTESTKKPNQLDALISFISTFN